jgi:hypothetical protein
MNPGELACYLYCLIPWGCGVEAAAAPGVDERHPVLIRDLVRDVVHDSAGISAVYSEVELEEFVGSAAEAYLQDLTWLGPRVCRHEAVIERAMSCAAVLPARFATLFTSLESLENYVLERREAIAGFFAQLGDRQEWAVKGLLDRAVALDKMGQPAGEMPAQDASPGALYFEQKRLKAQAEREFSQRLKEFCRQAASALDATAGGFRERKVLAAAAGEAEAVLNWAFLLAPAEIEEFRACLDRLNGGEAFAGLKLALTGPWPPFSFAPDLSAGARG